MSFLTAAAISAACLSAVCAAAAIPAPGAPLPLTLEGGRPLVGAYFFTHWWEPWKSSDDAIVKDLKRLKSMGFNTIFLDHEWSQMIDGDWKLLDRGHRLAKQEGVQILPWLSIKAGSDLGSPDRRARVKHMYGVDIRMGVGADGSEDRTKPYDEAVVEAGARYCLDYLERYLQDGALLEVMVDGKPRPVVAPTVELGWTGSCDTETQQMFRVWLRGKYGTLQKLNAAWKADAARWDDIDVCDAALFDLEGHSAGRAKHPAVVEDHVEFRAQVIDASMGEISRRIRKQYPEVLIASELPYQFEAEHPHAVAYRISQGANPSSAAHADILMLRATGPLTEREQKSLRDYRRRTGQSIILTYRTYDQWGRMLLAGEMSARDMVRDYADPSARLSDGFGFYSWNEMVDTHVVPDPDPPYHITSRITKEQSDAVVRALDAMAGAFIRAKSGAR